MLLMKDKDVVTLYHTYAPQILAYLTRRLPPETAKETLNDVFFEAVDAYPKLKEKKNLRPWLYKIAHNKTVDYYRKKKIKSFLLSQVPYLELIAQEINEPEFLMEKQKVKEAIEQAMKTLSEKYQHILRMRYEEQIPVKQIAVTLAMTQKATESLIFRARQHFIKAYERA